MAGRTFALHCRSVAEPFSTTGWDLRTPGAMKREGNEWARQCEGADEPWRNPGRRIRQQLARLARWRRLVEDNRRKEGKKLDGKDAPPPKIKRYS